MNLNMFLCADKFLTDLPRSHLPTKTRLMLLNMFKMNNSVTKTLWSDDVVVILLFDFGHIQHNEQFTQLTFTCSKSTMETLEKVVKYVQN